MHALPSVDAAVLAERRVAERVDARGGVWRFYAASIVTLTALISAIISSYHLDYGRLTGLGFAQGEAVAVDVCGATSTLAVVVAGVAATFYFSRVERANALAHCCFVANVLALSFIPLFLLFIGLARFVGE